MQNLKQLCAATPLFFILLLGCGGEQPKTPAARRTAPRQIQENLAPEQPKVAGPSALSSKSVKSQKTTNTVDAKKVEESELKITLPKAEELAIGNLGRVAAYVGESDAIGLYNMSMGKVFRTVYNPTLKPSSLAVCEDQRLLVVGGEKGHLKKFLVQTTNGMDDLALKRLAEDDVAKPLEAHTKMISSVAIEKVTGILATGDVEGQIKLWNGKQRSFNQADLVGGRLKLMTPLKGSSLVVGVTLANKLVFWDTKLADGFLEIKNVSFESEATSIAAGPAKDGFAVGDRQGWVYLVQLSGSRFESKKFKASGHSIKSVGFANLGSQQVLVSASSDGDIRAWELGGSKSLVRINANPPATSSTFSPKSDEIAVASSDSRLRIYSTTDGRPLRSHRAFGGTSLTSHAYSVDGELVAVGNEKGKLSIYKADSEKPLALMNLGRDSIEQLLIAPGNENKLVFKTSDGQLGLCQLPEIRSEQAFVGEKYTFDPTRKFMLASIRNQVTASDSVSGNLVRKQELPIGELASTITANEKLMFIGTESGNVFAWNFQEGGELEQVNADGGAGIAAMRFEPGGRLWVVDTEGVLSTYSTVMYGSTSNLAELDGKAQAAAVLSGRLFFKDDTGSVSVFDTARGSLDAIQGNSGAKFSKLRASGTSIGLSTKDEKTLLINSENIGEFETRFDSRLQCFATSETAVAAFDSSSKLNLIQLPKTSQFALRSEESETSKIVFSADGTKAVFTSNGMWWFDCATGNRKGLAVTGMPLCLSESGNQLVILEDSTLKIFDVSNSNSAKKLGSVDLEDSNVGSVQFISEFSILVGQDSGELHRWDFENQDELNFVSNLGDSISQLNLDRDRKFCACKMAGGKFAVVNLESGELLGGLPKKKVAALTSFKDGWAIGYDSGQLASLKIIGENVESTVIAELQEPALWLSSNSDGSMLAVVDPTNRISVFSDQGSLRSWSWVPSKNDSSPEAITNVVISAENAVLLANSNGELVVVPELNVQQLDFESGPMKMAALESDRYLKAVDSDGALKTWAKGNEGRWVAQESGSFSGIRDLASLGGGDYLLVGEDNSIFKIDANGARKELSPPSTKSFSYLGFLDRGKVVFASDDVYQLVDHNSVNSVASFSTTHELADAQKQLSKPDATQSPSNAESIKLEFESDAELNFFGSTICCKSQNQIQVMRVPDFRGAKVHRFEKLSCFDVFEEQKIAAVSTDGEISVLDLDSERLEKYQVGAFKDPFFVAWMDQSNLVLSNDKRTITFDTSTGQQTSNLVLDTKFKNAKYDSGLLWVQDVEKRVSPIRLPSVVWQQSYASGIKDAAWANNGKRIVVVASDGSLEMIEAADGKVIEQSVLPGRNFESIIGSQNGRHWVASNTKKIYKNREQEGGGSYEVLTLKSPLNRPIIANNGDRLYSLNGSELKVISLPFTTKEESESMISLSQDCQHIAMSNQGWAAATSKQGDTIEIFKADSSGRAIAKLDGLRELVVAPNLQNLAACDSEGNLLWINMISGQVDKWEECVVSVDSLAIDASSSYCAVVGKNKSNGNSSLQIFETFQQKPIATTELNVPADKIHFSADASMLFVRSSAGKVVVHDASTGEFLEVVDQEEVDSMIPAAGKLLLVANRNGSVRFVAPVLIAKNKISKYPVTAMCFISKDRFAIGLQNGECRILDSRFNEIQKLIGGLSAITMLTLSKNGKMLAAVTDDENNSTVLWNINSSSDSIQPTRVIESKKKPTSVAFSEDQKVLLIGSNNGDIEAWEVERDYQLAKFSGHKGPIRGIVNTKANVYVSVGRGKEFRSFKLPGLEKKKTKIRILTSDLISKIREPGIPLLYEKILEPEYEKYQSKIDIAREKASKKTGRAAALEALGADQQLKVEYVSAREIQKNSRASGFQKYQARKNLKRSVRELIQSQGRAESESNETESGQVDLLELGVNAYDYSNDFDNLAFGYPTNFNMRSVDNKRPSRVKLEFAGDILYAVQTESSDVSYQQRRLLSWEYQIQLLTRQWSVDSLSFGDLVHIPGTTDVASFPNIKIFSQDGSSFDFVNARKFSVSSADEEDQLLAIGSSRVGAQEGPVLKIYDMKDVKNRKVKAKSEFTRFKSTVSALQFGNRKNWLVFAVREQAVQRIFIADDKLSRVESIDEFSFSEGLNAQSRFSHEGIYNLAVSPGDDFIVGHGKFGDDDYRLLAWRIKWDENGRPIARRIANRKNDQPLIRNFGDKSLRVVQALDSGTRGKPSSRTSVLFAKDNEFLLVDLLNGKILRSMPIPTNRRPEIAVSDNGHWLATGDDKGQAYLWNTISGKRYRIGAEELITVGEQVMLAENADDRPEHSGRILGIELSPPRAGESFPAYAVTVGEENEIKVWDLFPAISAAEQVSTKNKRTRRNR